MDSLIILKLPIHQHECLSIYLSLLITIINAWVLFFCFVLFLNFILFFTHRFLLVIYFIHISICQSQSPNTSHHHHPLPRFPPLVSIHLFSTSVSLFLPCKPVNLYHFSRFHIYALICYICLSLSDLLPSV